LSTPSKRNVNSAKLNPDLICFKIFKMTLA